MNKGLVTKYIMPKRIVFSCGDIDNLEGLLKKKTGQIGLVEPDVTVLYSNSSLVLDFGKEVCGGVRFLIHIIEGDGRVRLRLGESVGECCAEPGEKNKGNNHSVIDSVVTLTSLSDQQFFQSGFRFLRIDVLDGNIKLELKSVYAAAVSYNKKFKGSFESSDALINKIFDVSAYTCKLCIQSMLWDGIKRDRLVWVGDIYPEMLTIRSLYGGDRCIEEALTFSKEQAPLPEFMNGMPTYSLWWILILKDYYMQNANHEYLLGQKDYLKGVVELFDGLVDGEGNCSLPQYFLDWQTFETDDARAGVRALFIMAIDAAKMLFEILDLDSEGCDALLSRLRLKSFAVQTAKQSLAFKMLACQSGAEGVDFLTAGGAKGYSTFMSYFISKAIALSGETETAVRILKDYYGAMLNRGATTFWEDFDIGWLDGSGRIDEPVAKGLKDLHGDYGAHCYKGFRHSLCHGWASGALPFIMEFVAGVQILEPGCRKVKIAPNPCGLDWFNAAYPTPHGVIKISYTSENGFSIDAPKEIEIVR